MKYRDLPYYIIIYIVCTYIYMTIYVGNSISGLGVTIFHAPSKLWPLDILDITHSQ